MRLDKWLWHARFFKSRSLATRYVEKARCRVDGRVTDKPHAIVVPGMSAGATDGLYLRNVGVPVYGLSALQMEAARDRSHGLDEAVPVKSLYRSREFWYQLVKDLTTTSPKTTS